MLIIKVGGGRSININGIAGDLSALTEKAIVVHGANAVRDELAVALGKEKTVVTSVSGYSSVLSDQAALDLLMLAYSGLQNKRMVQALQKAGVDAVGLSGLDGRAIQGRRNRGIRIKDGNKIKILRDFSGKPSAINTALLNLLLEHGYTPVLTMPIIDESLEAINSENDDVVALLQKEYSATTVIQLVEAPGLMSFQSSQASLIPYLNPADIGDLEAQADGRIKRKLHALGKLFAHSSTVVIIADGRGEHPIADALEGRGTVISSRQPKGGTRL